MLVSMRARLALALFTPSLICVAVAAQPTASGAHEATIAQASDAITVKPVIQGLLDRQGAPPKAMLPVIHAYVVKVNWADLQPTQGGPIVANNPIDVAIARVNKPDYAKLGMALKIRVVAGVGAPAWAKSLGGDPLPYYGSPAYGGGTGTIGRFWTPEFGTAYTDLENKLAAKYDTVPAVREVTVPRCTTMYDEPFVRDLGDPRNVATLLAAGYTVAADKQCILESIATQDVWKHTTTDVDFSPFPLITNPNGRRDMAFTLSTMDQCRAILGLRCGLQNNSLSSSKLVDPSFTQLYAYMTNLGAPIELQTTALADLGVPADVLAAAGTIGANSVELPSGYAKWPMPMLLHGAAVVVANPVS
jgi:hypothetical protein